MNCKIKWPYKMIIKAPTWNMAYSCSRNSCVSCWSGGGGGRGGVHQSFRNHSIKKKTNENKSSELNYRHEFTNWTQSTVCQNNACYVKADLFIFFCLIELQQTAVSLSAHSGDECCDLILLKAFTFQKVFFI